MLTTCLVQFTSDADYTCLFLSDADYICLFLFTSDADYMRLVLFTSDADYTCSVNHSVTVDTVDRNCIR